jgi:hypothetical protein
VPTIIPYIGSAIGALLGMVIALQTRLSLQDVFENNAATHDHIEVLSLTAQDPKIFKGVAVDGQEVGARARLQHA